MVAAVVPMAAADASGRLVRAAQRVIGTALGLVLAVALLPLHPRGVVAVLVIVALRIAAELLVGRNYALALIFVTPLALMMGQLVHESPITPLLRDRALDTAVGVVVAAVLTLLTRDRTAAD